MPVVLNESHQENSGYMFKGGFNFLPFYNALHAKFSAISFSLKNRTLRDLVYKDHFLFTLSLTTEINLMWALLCLSFLVDAYAKAVSVFQTIT